MIRTPFTAWVQPFRDSDIKYQVRWSHAQPEAKYLPWNAFGHCFFFDYGDVNTGPVGQTTDKTITYKKPWDSTFSGQCWIGTDDQWLNGIYLADLIPAPIPDCCKSEAKIIIVKAHGGSVLGEIYSWPDGLLADGKANVSLVTSFSALGCLLVGGTGLPQALYAVTPVGGVWLGDNAHTVALYSVICSGGAYASGVAGIGFIYLGSPSGGVYAGGESDPTVTYNVTPSAGVWGSGTTAPTATYLCPASGGALANGKASPLATYNLSPSGGALLAGAAVVTSVSGYVPSGGVLANGKAATLVTYLITPSGGGWLASSAVNVYLLDGAMGWNKYTITNSTFNAASTSQTVTLRTMAAGEVLHLYALNVDTTFQGGGTSQVTLAIGFSGGSGSPASNQGAYLSGNSIHDSTSAIPLTDASVNNKDGDCQNLASTWNITLTATSTGANLSAMTQGSLRIWLLTSTLP